MSFIEFRFFIFAGLTLLFYYLLPKKIQWIVLLIASLLFYCTWGIEHIPFIIGAALVSWLAANRMEKKYHVLNEQFAAEPELDKQQKSAMQAAVKKKCKKTLWIAVALILVVLVYTKTQTMLTGVPVLSKLVWLVSEVYHQIGTFFLHIPGLALFVESDLFTDHARVAVGMFFFVPLGISYYTFSLISYLADVYWRKDHAEKNFFRLLLFAVYFPKILQGPISRHNLLGAQLREEHRFDYTQFCYGLQLMLWGYFKKMVIADRLAVVVNTVFAASEKYSGSIYLVALIFATFQLYCDFSGCMDIAGGLSQTLGLKLEENFKRPFFAKSVAEFWRRWHATLGSWMREYIYIPLGGGRCAKWKKIRNALIVWLLVGLWHGTGWNYIAWGIYWGVLAACNVLFGPALKKLTALLKINTEAGSWKVFQMVRTFMLYVGGRVLTVPGDLKISLEVMRKILFELEIANLMDGTLFTLGLDRWNFIFGIVFLLVLWGVSLLQERGSVRERIAGSNIVFRWAIYYIAFFAIIIFGMYGPGFDALSFIYINY